MTESHLSRVGAPLRAPALSVRGLGPAEVTVAGLTAGGGALLLFVSEECPTSAMALRRLGPLCGAWQEAGLTATAVFEDPLEVAVRVARRLGWQAGVAAEDPPYRTSRAYRLVSVPTAVLVDRAGTIAGTVTGWDHAALVALIGRAGALLGAGLAIPEAAEPLLKPGCSSKAAIDPELAAAISVRAGTDDVEEMFERGWTDGLPAVAAADPGPGRGDARRLRRPGFPRPRPARHGRGDAGAGRGLRGAGRLPAGLLPGRGRDHPAGRAAGGGERAGAGGDRPEQRHGGARPGIPGEPHHRPGAAAARHPHRRRDARQAGPGDPGADGEGRVLHRRERGSEPLGAAARRARFRARPVGRHAHRQRRAAVDLRPPQPHPRGSRLGPGVGSGQRLEHQLVAAGGAVGVRNLPRTRRDVPRRRMDQTAAAPLHVRRGAQARRRAAPRRDDPRRPLRRTGRPGAQVGVAAGHRPDRGRRRGRALLCSSGPMHRHGIPDRIPGGGIAVAADYVSPFDERVRAAEPLAPRPASISGRRVVLLDIRKNRGAEFLDRIETLLQAAGAATARTTKEIFSKPAALALIGDIAGQADLVVEALAD